MSQLEKDTFFVGRTDTIEWILDTMNACKDGETAMVGIFGIGGIGKSAILKALVHRHEYSFLVNFRDHGDFYSRYRALVREINAKGIKTSISNRLLDLRTRLVKGIEPHRPESKRWIKDLVDWIPPLSQIAKIAVAMSTTGKKLHKLVDMHFGEVGVWLKEQLGKDYGRRFLELLRVNPGFAIQLFLDGLAQDLNNAVTEKDLPFLIMLDSIDHLDDFMRFPSKVGNEVVSLSEGELWHLFLTKVKGSLGVLAARTLPLPPQVLGVSRQDKEIQQLDRKSCNKILEKRGIPKEIRNIIILSSHESPFVIHAFCDAFERDALVISELTDFEQHTISEVYERSWKLLFDGLRHLSPIASRLALIPHFDRNIARLICPSLDPQIWRDFIRLSVITFEEPYFRMHEIARELAIRMVNEDTPEIILEASSILMKHYKESGNLSFLSLAVSSAALYSENHAMQELRPILRSFRMRHKYEEISELLESVEFRSDWFKSIQKGMLGQSYLDIGVLGDASVQFVEAISRYKTEPIEPKDERLLHVAGVLNNYALLCRSKGQLTDAETYLKDALAINNQFIDSHPDISQEGKAGNLNNLGNLYRRLGRFSESLKSLNESLNLFENLSARKEEEFFYNLVGVHNSLGLSYYGLRNYKQGELHFRRALDVVQQQLDKYPEIYLSLRGTILHNLGLLLKDSGNLNSSISMLTETLDIRKTLDEMLPFHIHISSVADTLNALGIACHRLGISSGNPKLLHESEERLRESIAIYRELDAEVSSFFEMNLANALNALGFLYTDIGKCSESLELHLEALDIWRSLPEEGNAYGAAIAANLNNIAIALHCLERWGTAGKYLLESMEIRKKLLENSRETHLVEMAMIYANFGKTYHGLSKCKEAEANFVKAIKMFHEAATKISEHHRRDVMKALQFLNLTYIECWGLSELESKKRIDNLILKELK